MGEGKHKDKSKDSNGKTAKKKYVAEEVDVESVPQNNEQDAMPEESRPSAFDVVFDYFKYNFGISYTGKKSVKELLQALSVFAPFGVAFIAAVKIMIFWENKGEFSVYHISDAYISVGENNIYDLLRVVAAVFVLLFVNMMYVALSIQEFKRLQWLRRCIGILVFWIMEIVFLFLCCAGLDILDPHGLITELTQASREYIISCLISLVALIVISHCFGMVISFDYKRRSKKPGEAEQSITKLNERKSIVFFGFIFVALILILGAASYMHGVSKARDKVAYKVVDSSVLSCNTGNHKSFAVVFENEEIYILEPINTDGTINYNVQLNVENKDILSTYKDNIR